MSSQLKVNSIRDTSNNEALTISSGNVSFNNTISAGTIGTGVTINAGTNVSGIGQMVGVSFAGNTSAGTNGNDVTIDPNKNYIIDFMAWNGTGSYEHHEVWRAVGNGTSHTFSHLSPNMTGSMGVGANSNGTCYVVVDSPFAYAKGIVFEEGSTHDIS